jgi:hypothetical protein
MLETQKTLQEVRSQALSSALYEDFAVYFYSLTILDHPFFNNNITSEKEIF